MNFIKNFTLDHSLHRNDVEKLTELSNILSEASKQIDVENTAEIKYLIQRVQYRYFLISISEINSVISAAVSSNKFTVAEALSRISVEMSVNLLFVLGGDRNARSKGLLKSYFEATKKKARKWEKYAAKSKCKLAEEAARELYQAMEVNEKVMVGLTNEPFEHWPQTSADKFCLVGKEEAYRTIFASSSDSIHLLGEDIFNITACGFLKEGNKEDLLAGIASEKASFAIYLFVWSLLFQSEAISNTIEKIGGHEAVLTTVKNVENELVRMYEQHESDARKYNHQNKK